ncbi:MAG: ferritin-like domain-containing protein [Planctomycetota bacterium]
MAQISTRGDLIAALHEASEIEHGLLLQYLFAAFSLKQRPSEGVTTEQFAILRQWKGILLSVAVDEMGHLGTVCNLLAAVGAAPHFSRPAFPQRNGYYPFPFELVPFSDEALERFVTAELPVGGAIADCLKDPSLGPLSAFEALDLAPEVPAYNYVGELYGHIKQGIQAIPESQLFIGTPPRQVDNNWSVNVDMRVVKDRVTALDAIDDIVRDGEGAPGGRFGSHYGKYCQMWRTFRSSPFQAARPVARNPLTRSERQASGVPTTLISDHTSLAVAELFNLTYSLALQLLAQFFANAGESEVQRREIRLASARLMSTGVRPIAEVLTALPASTVGEDTAGPTFELYLPVVVPPEIANRWILVFEAFDQIIAEATRLAAVSSDLSRLAAVADTLSVMKRSLQVAARSGS